MKTSKLEGWLYIIHFTPPYKHARHYVGFAEDIAKRFADHLAGKGARLVAVAMAAGCRMDIFPIKRGTRKDERKIKNKVRQLALEFAKEFRPFNHFERVGKPFLDRIEAQTRAAILREVKAHPSKGKTLL